MRNLCRISFMFTLGLLALFIGTASAELVIDQNYKLISSARFGRTAYDYTYQVNITNNESDVQDVTAIVTSSSPNTTIIDGNVNFGDVAATTTVASTDTFTIRQNRRYPFEPSSLTWEIQSRSRVDLPPDPGEEGKQTLLGLDSDSDGVRDDIQRYIYYAHPNDEKIRVALTQIAIEYQGLLSQASDPDAAFTHATRLARHGECLFYIQGETSSDTRAALKAEFLNTRERSLAYINYSNTLGGEIILGAPVQDWKNSCNFDVDAIGGVQ